MVRPGAVPAHGSPSADRLVTLLGDADDLLSLLRERHHAPRGSGLFALPGAGRLRPDSGGQVAGPRANEAGRVLDPWFIRAAKMVRRQALRPALGRGRTDLRFALRQSLVHCARYEVRPTSRDRHSE